MASDPLIRPVRSGTVRVAVAGAAALLVAMAIWLRDRGRTGVDDWAAREIYAHVGSGTGRVLLDLSSPLVSLLVPAAVAICAAYRRQWTLVLLAVVGPALATALCEWVGKPLVDRVLGGVGSFPSGHETGICSAVLVLGVAAALFTAARRLIVGVWLVLAVWALAAAVGLVRAGYHYATDVLGAIALSTVVVLGAALAMDALVSRHRASRADQAQPVRS